MCFAKVLSISRCRGTDGWFLTRISQVTRFFFCLRNQEFDLSGTPIRLVAKVYYRIGNFPILIRNFGVTLGTPHTFAVSIGQFLTLLRCCFYPTRIWIFPRLMASCLTLVPYDLTFLTQKFFFEWSSLFTCIINKITCYCRCEFEPSCYQQ